MSHTIAFDTLVYAKKLKEGGFTDRQAEAQAAALTEVVEDNLATKRDIELIRRDIKVEIEGIRRDIKELELRLKHDLTVRLGGMIGIAVAVIAVLIKLL